MISLTEIGPTLFPEHGKFERIKSDQLSSLWLHFLSPQCNLYALTIFLAHIVRSLANSLISNFGVAALYTITHLICNQNYSIQIPPKTLPKNAFMYNTFLPPLLPSHPYFPATNSKCQPQPLRPPPHPYAALPFPYPLHPQSPFLNLTKNPLVYHSQSPSAASQNSRTK